MFTESEKKQLGKLNKALSRVIKIGLTAPDNPQAGVFREFCDNLVQLVPKIKITSEDSSPRQLPQILIGEGIRYQAVPGGLEMPPFIEALAALDSESRQLAEPFKFHSEEMPFRRPAAEYSEEDSRRSLGRFPALLSDVS